MCYWRIGIERFGSNESSFSGDDFDDNVPKAPYRDIKGNMPGFKLTMPEVKPKDDWRYYG